MLGDLSLFLVKRRAVYDQFGEEGLKGGIPNTEDGKFEGILMLHQ